MSYLKLKEIVENNFTNKDKYENQNKYSLVLAYNQYKQFPENHKGVIINSNCNFLLQLDEEDIMYLYKKYSFMTNKSKKEEIKYLNKEEEYLKEQVSNYYEEIHMLRNKKQKIYNEHI